MDSSHFEAAHKYLIKAFWDRTNKYKDEFEQQILHHNIRLTNVLAMVDYFNHAANITATAVEKNPGSQLI
jgi:hypothetical protein